MRSLTDTTGQTVTDSYVYKAFGDVQTSTGTTVNAFRFVGQAGYYFDPDFLEYLLRARVYNTGSGRFISLDPLYYLTSTNLYLYVMNRPNFHIDPSGKLYIEQVGVAKLDPPFTCRGDDAFINWLYILDKKHDCDGYIVQMVELYCEEGKCGGCNVPDKCPKEPPKKLLKRFWEYWRVPPKNDRPPTKEDFTDQSRHTFFNTTCGAKRVVGTVKFYCRKSKDDGGEGVIGTGELKWQKECTYGTDQCKVKATDCTDEPPKFWDKDPVEDPDKRWALFIWNCCGAPDVKADAKPRKPKPAENK